MSDLGTYEIDNNILQTSNDQLKIHKKELKEDMDKAKQLLNISSNEKLSYFIKLLDDKVIPVLDKYTNKMDDLLLDTNSVQKESI